MSLLVPCRLFVIIAREARVAVVLRRGPSAWCHMIRWDMAADRFEHGAWIKARIYEEKCDLSPDGELFLYFVHQGRRSQTSYSHAWTAVSRPPWLHALALWPQATTYGGGGRFVGKREVLIRNRSLAAHPDHPGAGITASSGNPPRHVSTEVAEGADWSGRDHEEHVVFARGGKLFRRLAEHELELADFNGLRPDPVEAPDWARKPLLGSVKSARRRR